MSAPEIAAALKLRRSGRQWRGVCPVHGGTKDPFALGEGTDGALLVHCHAGCDAIAILAELRHRGLLSGREDHDRRDVEISRSAPRERPPANLDWSPRAEHIWRQTEPLIGSPVEVYLRTRRCALPRSDDIRYLPPGMLGPYPSMCSRVTDVFTAAPITLHFTRLTLDGTGKAPVEKPKLLLTGHRKSGGCIRLSPDDDVTLGLGLAEGIETGLAVLAAGWSPLWAAIDAGNLTAFPVLAGIETLTIFADHDKAGLQAGETCRDRWLKAHRDACIVNPRTVGADWADTDEAAA